MERTCYLIERYRDQWVVSASGAKIMTCKKKSTALKTVRRATVLLHGQEAASPDRESGCSEDPVDRAPVSVALFYALPACWLTGIAMASLKAVSGDRETVREGACRPLRKMVDARVKPLA